MKMMGNFCDIFVFKYFSVVFVLYNASNCSICLVDFRHFRLLNIKIRTSHTKILVDCKSNKNFLRFQAFRGTTLRQPTISYKVIRRFTSSKEFETPFGLQLLANILTGLIHNDRLPIKKHTDSDSPRKSTPVPSCDSDSLRKRTPVSSCDSDSLSSNLSDDTVLYDEETYRDLKERKEVNPDKETFFSSSSSSSDSAEGSGDSASGARRKPGKRGTRRTKKKTETSGVDGGEKELLNLLRMTDFDPSARAETSCPVGEEEDKPETKKKSGAKEKKEELSLLDCLDAGDCMDGGSNPESEMQVSDTAFLSAINSEMKNTFLQSSEESAGGEKSDSGEDQPQKTPARGETKERPKSGKKDELSKYRFPVVKDDEHRSEKSRGNGEDPALSDDSSSSSVEYVQHVKKKRSKKDETKSEHTSDSDSDIQQVYCKTRSPTKTPLKGRKNINKILRKDSLQLETKQALKMETERRKRVSERMKLYEKLFPDKEEKLVLDFDPDTKEELVVVDSRLSAQLKPHQKEGVRFMWNCCFESMERLEEDSGSGCVLAHCMGLGKTLQVITLVHTVLTQNTGVHTVLIMCPMNTLRNWAHEFRTWQKECDRKFKPLDLIPCKTKHGRMTKVKTWSQQGGVLLISYDMFRSLTKQDFQGNTAFSQGFLDPGPDLVVCDEGHVLKNHNSALSKQISRIKTLRRIILTGTPLQNNLIEYYCMVQFVKPNILGTKKEFLNRFVNPINNGQFEDSTQQDVRLMKRRAHVLHTMLDGFIQRRGYYVLTPFLPEKQEYVISVALTETQENIYRLFIEQCSRENHGLLRDFHWVQKVWTHPRNMLTHSRKNKNRECSDKWKKFVQEEEYNSIESSGKLLLLFRILKRCKEIGDKVLVFSQSLYSLDLIEFFLRKANGYHCSGTEMEFADSWVLGQDYFRLEGSTSCDDRDFACQRFNNVEDTRARLFLISTRAGGLGISLVAANRVVVFDASWNPTHDVQSIFRVYRFGQKKTCYIYRFLAAATMEEKIYKRQVTKLSLAHRILDEHQIERHYTMGNLQELYRYDPVPKAEWRVPKIPKDKLFAEILATNRNIIVGYHEHDSLLENKEGEELTEEERRAAWEDYEKEKLAPQNPRMMNGNTIVLPPPGGPPMVWMNSGNVPEYGRVPAPAPNLERPLISQSGSNLCKIVEVRTLNKGNVRYGGVNVGKLLQFSRAFDVRQKNGEGFEQFCDRVYKSYVRMFPC